MGVFQEIPDADACAYLIEYLNVVFEPRTEHVDRAVALAGGDDQRAVEEDFHVVLDRLVLQTEIDRKLVQVPRPHPDRLNDPGPVLPAPLTTQ